MPMTVTFPQQALYRLPLHRVTPLDVVQMQMTAIGSGDFLLVLAPDPDDFEVDTEAPTTRGIPCANLSKGGRLQMVAGDVEVLAWDSAMTITPRVVDPNRIETHGLVPAEIEQVRQGHKIQAIKLVRERKGLGLREAKDLVDRYCEVHGLSGYPLPEPIPFQHRD